MPELTSFSLPAFVQDFPEGSPQDQELKFRWNVNVYGWITQAIVGAQPPSGSPFFYDPLVTDIPDGSPSLLVQWVAFPGRLDQFYSSNPPNQPAGPYGLSQDQVYSLADTGQYVGNDGNSLTFQPIPASLCPQADWTGALKTFGPYGPRGWLDEYCEWSAARDTDGNLLRVDFACENPEYWNTLWKVSPDQVVSIYQSILNWDAPAERQIDVQPEDLYLFYDGQVVTDPDTGRPCYNPLNKWNSGPVAQRTGDQGSFCGGVMHLTSTPNTLQTELGLAGAATVQYNPPNGQKDAQSLICCGNYGQEYRHSDPHIGQSVNQAVAGDLTGGVPQLVCLADPVGLYLQMPDLSGFSFGPNINPANLPPNAQASDVWQVLRGSPAVVDPVTGQDFPGAMVLHAIAQIPSSWLAAYPNMTLADIQIDNQPIQWAGQIAEQFKVGLYARPLQAPSNPPSAPCAGTTPTPGAPLQAMYASVWDAFYNNVEVAPTGQEMSLASNTTYIAPWLPANGQSASLVLTCNTPSPGNLAVEVLLPDGSGPDTSIPISIFNSATVTYAVPGNSYPGTYTALYLDLTVPQGAAGGLRGMQIIDPVSGPQSYPALIYIVGN
jgi:hypothetical protein